MLATFTYEAGSWEVDCDRRELRAHGRAVPMGARAFDIVEKLAESAGRFVSKDELVAHVWRGTVVEESTLRVHIHAIRKALGPDRTLLKTAAGRGYRLLGRWTSTSGQDVPGGLAWTSILRRLTPGNLPAPASALIGRAAEIQQLRDLVSAFRVVTLTGPGGIGKTTLAVELARTLAPEFDGRVCLVEFALLADPKLVPAAVAVALGLQSEGKAITAQEVARGIGTAKVLLVLDNCEHLVDAAARLAEEIMRRCPRTSLLVTSREVLRIDGERVFRVAPLEVPESDREPSERQLARSAVELFVARTQALDDRFVADAGSLAAISSICRQLDGIPLAIEFAAARAATLGVQQVAAGLRDRFGLLAGRRRTALPRHQTLRAVLDWSYELLNREEQSLLHHLAVFAGGFTLDAAAAVVGVPDQSLLLEAIDGLVMKSLVSLDESSGTGRWRLLETIRAYALEKLVASGGYDSVARRHAEFHRDLFERSEPEWLVRPPAELHADYAWRIDNVRTALDWAFSDKGDGAIAIALTVAAAPLWMHLSLYDECRRRCRHALVLLACMDAPEVRCEMKLHAALAGSIVFSGESPAEAEAAWERSLQLADQIGDVDYRLRSLGGLWLLKQNRALELAHQFADIARKPADRLMGLRMLGVSYHYQGNQDKARGYIEQFIADSSLHEADLGAIRFQLDQKAAAQVFLARILWVQGFPAKAMSAANRAVERAEAINQGLSLSHALALAACPIALWAGDLDLARRYIGQLAEYAARNDRHLGAATARCHLGTLHIRTGDLVEGIKLLRAGFEELRAGNPGFRFDMFLGELALALGRSGRFEEANASIEAAIADATLTGEGWIQPELLRIKGEILRLAGAPDANAEVCFRHAMDEAHGQGALAWELRAATSLARLLQSQGRGAEAREVLKPVYDRFTEGHDTADLLAARAVLSS